MNKTMSCFCTNPGIFPSLKALHLTISIAFGTPSVTSKWSTVSEGKRC